MREILADLRTVLFWTLIGLIVLLVLLLGLAFWNGFSGLNSWLHPF